MKLYQVDAFTEEIFGGNPAAVCIVEEALPETLMQKIASEVNLSDTAFLRPMGQAYEIRWFTPVSEVDLCGHASLASAHVLWAYDYVDKDRTIEFVSKSGPLKAKLVSGQVQLDFPQTPVTMIHDQGLVDQMAAIFKTQVIALGRSRFDYLIEVESESALRALAPDQTLMETVTTRGFILTSRSDQEGVDFVSRFFGPAIGIYEDPVTGSAHAALGPYWSEILGKKDMNALQLSKRRGHLRVGLSDDRVLIAGHAVTVYESEWHL